MNTPIQQLMDTSKRIDEILKTFSNNQSEVIMSELSHLQEEIDDCINLWEYVETNFYIEKNHGS